MSKYISYEQSGVNIDANDAMVEQIRSSVTRTFGPRVLPLKGGFAGLFRLDFNEKLFKKSVSYYEIGCDLTKTLGLDKDGRLEVININSLKRSDRTLVVEKFFEEADNISDFFYGLDKPISRKEFIEKATKRFLESIEE